MPAATDLRADAIALLERLAGLESDPGSAGYAEGMADRLRTNRSQPVTQDYVDRLSAAVDRLEAEVPSCAFCGTHGCFHGGGCAGAVADALLAKAAGLVEEALDLDGLERGSYTDHMVAALEDLRRGRQRLRLPEVSA